MRSLSLVLCLVDGGGLVRGDDATCGSVRYSSDQVSKASEAACDYVGKKGTAGGSTYPHQYKNYEGFGFNGLKGPFYEFPIKTGGVYNGGSPGADRVIVTKGSSCTEAGVITHRGASGNNFVACQVAGKNSTKNDDKNDENDKNDKKNSGNGKKASSADSLSQHKLLGAASVAGVATLLFLL